MTLEELESEMAAAASNNNAVVATATPKPMSVASPMRLRNSVSAVVESTASTTAKDGITTWIPSVAPSAKPKIVDTPKPAVASSNNTNSQKIDKIAKVEPAANKKPATATTNTANKPKPPVKPLPSAAILFASKNNNSNTTSEAVPPPTKAAKPNQQPAAKPKPAVAKKPATTATPKIVATTVASTPTTAATIVETTAADHSAEIDNAAIPIVSTTETPTPFLVLEPKDADFDLPQDRSPDRLPTKTTKKPKRPLKSGTKRKPSTNKNKKAAAVTAAAAATDVSAVVDATDVNNQNSTKSTALSTVAANKTKPKPMTTQIYNFLSREIMPNVGVGILGLVVTAGLASYFLNPLAALRRSYDVAERKDDMYHYNNEEYAGLGASDGQSEEEIFGKVIAGMPTNTYRNSIRYVGGQQSQVQQRHPNQYKPTAYDLSSQIRNRNVHQQQQHRVPSPSYASYASQYGQQRTASNNHHQQQLANHPMPTNVLLQKSIPAANSRPMYVHPNSGATADIGSEVTTANKDVKKATITSSDSTILQPSHQLIEQTQHQHEQPKLQPNAQDTTAHNQYVYAVPASDADNSATEAASSNDETAAQRNNIALSTSTDKSYTDQYLMDSNPNNNELMRRSQFVVGSVALADAQAAALTAVDPTLNGGVAKYPSIVLPEHGPRRFRRAVAEAAAAAGEISPTNTESAMISDVSTASNPSVNPTTAATHALADDEPPACPSSTSMSENEKAYAQLRQRFDKSLAARVNVNIQAEMKRLEYRMRRLRRVEADVRDIEQFRSELSLEPKGVELYAETLTGGLVQLCSELRFVGELLNDPRQAADRLAERSMMSRRVALSKTMASDAARPNEVDGGDGVEKATTSMPTTRQPEDGADVSMTRQPTLLEGLLKMLELKSVFATHVLRSIRPAFDRAVSDVFHFNQTMIDGPN